MAGGVFGKHGGGALGVLGNDGGGAFDVFDKNGGGVFFAEGPPAAAADGGRLGDVNDASPVHILTQRRLPTLDFRAFRVASPMAH